MALTREQKAEVVSEINNAASGALSALAADYRGLTVSEMTELRSKAREKGVYMRVTRNTLFRRALEGTEFECMAEALQGPLFLAFAKDEPSLAAKIMRDFAKDHDNLEVKALSIGGQLLDASHLEAVANLPTKEEALTKLVFVMKAPITKLARTMKEVPGKLVRTMAAVADQKRTEQ